MQTSISAWKPHNPVNGHSTTKSVEYNPKASHTERITFANGGAIEDKFDEGGLRLTSPDGEASDVENYGFVMPYGMDKELYDQPEVEQSEFGVVFKDDENDEWTQTFPKSGGTVLELNGSQFGISGPEPDLVITIDRNGKAVTTYDGETYPTPLKSDNDRLSVPTIFGEITPPVPVEWLIA